MMYRCRLRQRLKRSDFVQPVVREVRAIRREVTWIANAARSGKLWGTFRNQALSHQLRSQKVITYTIALPSLWNSHSLMHWLDHKSVRYQEGVFCVYIPPHEEMRDLFEPILSAYPRNSGLKILKDLKPPAQAKYVSKSVHSHAPRVADWTTCRPTDFLRVANYLYYHEIGPRIYDLIEIQTPHNSLTAYVVQHVGGTTPSEDEYTAFVDRLDQLSEDQLIPSPGGASDWKARGDFRGPDCHGNLIRDRDTGKVLYVDFQSFMLRDARQHILQIGGVIREDGRFGVTHRIGRRCYFNLCVGRDGTDLGWNLFKQRLRRQGISLEGAVVLDVGCSTGMTIYSALADGAVWAVGWDKPDAAAVAQKLLLALGMTRFDIIGRDISSDADFHSLVPEHLNLSSNANTILFLRAMKNTGFPDSLKRLPFGYMIYQGHTGEALEQVGRHLNDIVDNWNLHIVDIFPCQDGDVAKEHPVAILRRNQ